jgi:hypothetical protein
MAASAGLHVSSKALSISAYSYGGGYISFGCCGYSRNSYQSQNVVQEMGSGANIQGDRTLALGKIPVSASVSLRFQLQELPGSARSRKRRINSRNRSIERCDWSVICLMFAADTPEAAKQFLQGKLLEQAQRDGVELSDIEKRIFLFSETSGETDWEAEERFEAECDDAKYEAKIAKLMRRSYAHDKESAEEKSAWEAALQVLRDEYFYGLVMVDQARIPRPKPSFAVTGKRVAKSFVGLGNTRFLAAKVALMVLALILAFDPLHWGLVQGDLPKLLCVALAVATVWALGRFERRVLLRKTDDRR